MTRLHLPALFFEDHMNRVNSPGLDVVGLKGRLFVVDATDAGLDALLSDAQAYADAAHEHPHPVIASARRTVAAIRKQTT